MPAHLLVSWRAKDEDHPVAGEKKVEGPLASVVRERHAEFDRILLLSNFTDTSHKNRSEDYARQLQEVSQGTPVELWHRPVKDPSSYTELTTAVTKVFADIDERFGNNISLSLHLTSGTKAMQAVWVLLSQTTRFPHPTLIDCQVTQWQEKTTKGRIERLPANTVVRTVELPFEFSAEVVYREREALERKQKEALGPSPESFDEIKRTSRQMEECIREVQRIAPLNIPVLIEGETGTGKRLFAESIHAEYVAAGRGTAPYPFLTVNCATLPEELLESELFGHELGAFTGATTRKLGLWEQARGGTLFLDEIGQLEPRSQAKFLTAIQNGKIRRLGGLEEIDVSSARVIAATNLPLRDAIREQRFREDLYQRLSVGAYTIPPLRERRGDVAYLLDLFLTQANTRLAEEMPDYQKKVLSPAARNRLLRHSWPGNVRELENTVLGLAIRLRSERVELDNVERILRLSYAEDTDVLNHAIGNGFKLSDMTDHVERHYLERALDETGNNRTRAAQLLGLPNYQMLNRLRERLGLQIAGARVPDRRAASD